MDNNNLKEKLSQIISDPDNEREHPIQCAFYRKALDKTSDSPLLKFFLDTVNDTNESSTAEGLIAVYELFLEKDKNLSWYSAASYINENTAAPRDFFIILCNYINEDVNGELLQDWAEQCKDAEAFEVCILKHLYGQATQKISIMQSEKDKLQKSLKTEKSRASNFEQQLKARQHRELNEQELSDLQAEKDKLCEQVSDLTDKNEELAGQITELERQCEAEKNAAEDLKRQYEEAGQNTEALKKQYETEKQEELSDLQAEKDKLREQVSDLTDKNEELTGQITELERQCEAEKDDLLARTEQAEAQAADLEQQLKKWEKYEGRIKFLERKLDRQSKIYEQMELTADRKMNEDLVRLENEKLNLERQLSEERSISDGYLARLNVLTVQGGSHLPVTADYSAADQSEAVLNSASGNADDTSFSDTNGNVITIEYEETDSHPIENRRGESCRIAGVFERIFGKFQLNAFNKLSRTEQDQRVLAKMIDKHYSNNAIQIIGKALKSDINISRGKLIGIMNTRSEDDAVRFCGGDINYQDDDVAEMLVD